MNATLRRAAPLSALALLLATNAAAQPSPKADDAAYQAASERFAEGARLLREGKREHNVPKLERAYLEFKQANAIYPRAKSGLLNLIESELATNRSLDAMKHLREFLRLHGRPESGELSSIFQEQWDLASQATGHIRVDAPPGRRIVLDGKDEAGVAPLADPVDVPPGHHMLEAEGLRAEVDAAAGVVVDASLAVPSAVQPPAGAPPPPTPSSVPMEGPPSTGSLPPAPPDAVEPSGPHGYWSPMRTWGVVVGSAGLVSLGLGAFFATQASNDGSRAASILTRTGTNGCAGPGANTPDCQSLNSAYDDQSRDHALNLVFVGVGVAGAVASAALLLWPQPSHSTSAKAAPMLVPLLSSHAGGIQLRGEL